MNTTRKIRFLDERLQSAFVQELVRVNCPYTFNKAGSVVYAPSNAEVITNAAHAIRDSLFKWYFLKWNNNRETFRFAALLKEASLPFYLEEHESGIWFVVRSEDKASHERLAKQVHPEPQEKNKNRGTTRKASNQAL